MTWLQHKSPNNSFVRKPRRTSWGIILHWIQWIHLDWIELIECDATSLFKDHHKRDITSLQMRHHSCLKIITNNNRKENMRHITPVQKLVVLSRIFKSLKSQLCFRAAGRAFAQLVVLSRTLVQNWLCFHASGRALTRLVVLSLSLHTRVSGPGRAAGRRLVFYITSVMYVHV